MLPSNDRQYRCLVISCTLDIWYVKRGIAYIFPCTHAQTREVVNDNYLYSITKMNRRLLMLDKAFPHARPKLSITNIFMPALGNKLANARKETAGNKH